MNKVLHNHWEKAVAEMACQSIAREILEMDVSDVVISDELTERVSKLFADEAARRARRKTLNRRRIVIIAVAAVLLLLTACVAITAIRQKSYNMILTYYDKYFSYKSAPPIADDPVSGTVTNPIPQDTASSDTSTRPPAEAVWQDRPPAYLPEGYVLYQSNSRQSALRLIYRNPCDNSIFTYDQTLIGVSDYKINREDAQITEIQINEYPAIAAVHDSDCGGLVTILWNDGLYDYKIAAPTTLAEALKIAESVYLTSK